MTSLTVIWNLLNLAIVSLLLWSGIASLAAGIRLAFRPLVYLAMLEILMATPFIVALFAQQWITSAFILGFVALIALRVSGLNSKIQAHLQSRSLTFWDLLRFKYT